MDRRDFFRRGLGKATEVAVKVADKRVSDRAKHWIRPPYAIPELDFLLACTRCNACIDACPHNIIFPLAARLGADVVNTPALDLLKKGCQLCEDWPCVNACEVNALVLPEVDQNGSVSIKKIAAAEIDTSSCLPYSGPECGACESVCPVQGALVFEREKPGINLEFCVGCALCREACIVEDKAINIKPL
ncbi:MAG: 4Fe-4S binding protein [Gammaproteobacteria bacterium]|nr:4Fe-4S binding protein [Gammaproteobacteria bacterium]